MTGQNKINNEPYPGYLPPDYVKGIGQNEFQKLLKYICDGVS